MTGPQALLSEMQLYLNFYITIHASYHICYAHSFAVKWKYLLQVISFCRQALSG